MVGTRITPDNNDIVVWKLDEATAPFLNSSTSTSAPSHAVSDLNTISGTVMTQQPSPFASSGPNSAVLFTGNNSGSPRNFISGANNFLPQPPMTISCWIVVRNYDTTGFTQHGVSKQTTTGVWSGVTFASINLAQNERYNGSGLTNTSRFDFSIATNSSNNGANANTFVDHTIPLNTWCHIGWTYDGTTVLSYVNGTNVNSAVASPTGNIFYSGTPGPWFLGAIPSGSGNPEECNYNYCDIRFANIVRPQSYFQNIYQSGTLNAIGQALLTTTYYKMRAYDVYYTTTALYWVDSVISYAKAPASPSGIGLGPIEILDSWQVIN